MRALLFTFLAMFCLTANAQTFTDMNQAAKAGLIEAHQCTHGYECGGFIYEDQNHKYHVSRVVTSKIPFGNPAMGDLYAEPIPKGWKIVADFHTHICSIHNRMFANFFSPADANSNQGLHLVGYMLSECDGNIRRYDPSQDDRDDEEVDFKSGKIIYLTIGHISGWIDVNSVPASSSR